LGKWVGILKLISVVQVVFFFFSFSWFKKKMGLKLKLFFKFWVQNVLLWRNFGFFFGLKFNDFLKNNCQHLKIIII